MKTIVTFDFSDQISTPTFRGPDKKNRHVGARIRTLAVERGNFVLLNFDGSVVRYKVIHVVTLSDHWSYVHLKKVRRHSFGEVHHLIGWGLLGRIRKGPKK